MPSVALNFYCIATTFYSCRHTDVGVVGYNPSGLTAAMDYIGATLSTQDIRYYLIIHVTAKVAL